MRFIALIFTFSNLADAFIQSDLLYNWGLNQVREKQRKCSKYKVQTLHGVA